MHEKTLKVVQHRAVCGERLEGPGTNNEWTAHNRLCVRIVMHDKKPATAKRSENKLVTMQHAIKQATINISGALGRCHLLH